MLGPRAELEQFVQQGVHLTYRRQYSAPLTVSTPNADQQSQFTLDRVPIPRAAFHRSAHCVIVAPKSQRQQQDAPELTLRSLPDLPLDAEIEAGVQLTRALLRASVDLDGGSPGTKRPFVG